MGKKSEQSSWWFIIIDPVVEDRNFSINSTLHSVPCSPRWISSVEPSPPNLRESSCPPTEVLCDIIVSSSLYSWGSFPVSCCTGRFLSAEPKVTSDYGVTPETSRVHHMGTLNKHKHASMNAPWVALALFLYLTAASELSGGWQLQIVPIKVTTADWSMG